MVGRDCDPQFLEVSQGAGLISGEGEEDPNRRGKSDELSLLQLTMRRFSEPFLPCSATLWREGEEADTPRPKEGTEPWLPSWKRSGSILSFLSFPSFLSAEAGSRRKEVHLQLKWGLLFSTGHIRKS